jgi:FOG: CBS domain
MFIPSLSQVINRNPLTVTPETPVEEAIELMSSTGASYVLVVEPRGNSQFGNPTTGLPHNRGNSRVSTTAYRVRYTQEATGCVWPAQKLPIWAARQCWGFLQREMSYS